jgi:hypothetical protein
MTQQRSITQSPRTATLADVLERVLDKGVVVAGDIKIKLVDVELLTIQVRLVICTVDKALEMGMNWWTLDPNLSPLARLPAPPQVTPVAPLDAGSEKDLAPDLAQRLDALEAVVAKLGGAP